MSNASEFGFFRRRLFGGFRKKEVFSFVDKLQSDHNAEVLQLNEKLAAVQEELESERSADGSRARQVEQLETQLADVKSVLAEGEAVGADYEKLSDLCRQMKNANSEMQQLNLRLKSRNDELESRVGELSAQLEAMDRRAVQYENTHSALMDEIYRLKDFVKELGKRLKENEDYSVYKTRFEELTERSTGLEAETASLRKLLDGERARKNQLESAIRDLASIDFSVFDDASMKLTDIVGASKSVRASVMAALKKCGENVDSPDDQPSVESDRAPSVNITAGIDNDALIDEMLKQIEHTNQLIAQAENDFKQSHSGIRPSVDAD